MKKFVIALLMSGALLASAQPAAAFGSHHFHWFFFKKHFWHPYHPPKHPPKPPVKAPATPKANGTLGNSQVSWVPQYIFASTACSALVLWVQALHVGRTERRELTQKEAWTTVGNCFLPIIGGHIMGSLAQQP